MPKGSIIAPFNPIVVNTGAKLVLIDTGYGPGIAPTVGLLPARADCLMTTQLRSISCARPCPVPSSDPRL